MKSAPILATAACLAALGVATEAAAQTRVEVGVLTCNARGSTGMILGSTRDLRCTFKRSGRDEFYRGTINKVGLDIGST